MFAKPVMLDGNSFMWLRYESLRECNGTRIMFNILTVSECNMSIEFFTVCTKLAEMAILYSKDLTTAKKKLPPMGLDLVQEIIAGLGVQL